MQVLDFGYCNLVETWGSDERIIEAARMSTDKGFQGWGPKPNCRHCGAHIESENLLTSNACNKPPHDFSGDEKLLRYLWINRHMTPFEMAGMIIEVQAPIFVVREWQRHRTQSYNELSGRYTTLPDLYYIPSIERLMAGKQAAKNKQGSDGGFAEIEAWELQEQLKKATSLARQAYENFLYVGLARELSRLVVPVNQYTRFRASANLRNWLQFLDLRLPDNVQWEFREYSNAVATMIADAFPRTYALFDEERNAH